MIIALVLTPTDDRGVRADLSVDNDLITPPNTLTRLYWLIALSYSTLLTLHCVDVLHMCAYYSL